MKKVIMLMILLMIKIMIMLIILMMMTMGSWSWWVWWWRWWWCCCWWQLFVSHLTASSEDMVRIDGCLAACTTSESLRCFSLSCLPLIALYAQYIYSLIVMMLIMILMIKMMIEIKDSSLYKSPISMHHIVPLSYSPIIVQAHHIIN
jgi:Ca2+/Na+ antiporter